MKKVLVCGASGYVGRHLIRELARRGDKVYAVANRPVCQWPEIFDGVSCYSADLRNPDVTDTLVEGMDHVYNLAAAVGGIGFVESNNATSLANVVINANLLRASALAGVERFFFASSSCVYPGNIETPLKESDAYPANPMGGYGWEKLFSERACLAYAAEKNLPCSIARYHGIYGPGDFRPPGRDHVATALARKIVLAKKTENPVVKVWGDGQQTRSLLYIDDCVEGTIRMMEREVEGPLNLAHPIPMTVNNILTLLEGIAEFKVVREFDLSKPQGRRYKTSDNDNLRSALNWQPSTGHYLGLRRLYESVWNLNEK